MMYLVTVPLLAFFACLLYGMYQATDIETDWTIPPYDWNFEDEDLWLPEPDLLDYQRRED
jgi:hypothetical protein